MHVLGLRSEHGALGRRQFNSFKGVTRRGNFGLPRDRTAAMRRKHLFTCEPIVRARGPWRWAARVRRSRGETNIGFGLPKLLVCRDSQEVQSFTKKLTSAKRSPAHPAQLTPEAGNRKLLVRQHSQAQAHDETRCSTCLGS
jgi:hypothetical protein